MARLKNLSRFAVAFFTSRLNIEFLMLSIEFLMLFLMAGFCGTCCIGDLQEVKDEN